MDTPPAASVLLVDDNSDAADALGMLLETFGYPTRVVTSAEEARRMVASGYQPDVLIVDLYLGSDSGYDLARDLCAELPDRHLLIAVTGYPRMDARSLAEGFDHHFLKPTDLPALRRALAAHERKLVGRAIG